LGVLRQFENEAFRDFINNKNQTIIDQYVFEINEFVEDKIDCTKCGACCKSLMINLTSNESENASMHLNMSEPDFKEKYIEESQQGMMIINSIPCHFLENDKCTIYENRFKECRDFPHLNKPNFSQRLFATLIHYSICPIIFNVVEQLKIKTNFFHEQ